MERISRMITVYATASIASDCLLWLVRPIIENFMNGAFKENSTHKLQTCMYMVLPLDFENNWKHWLIAQIISFYTAGFGCALFIVSDSILFTLVWHMIGRIQIMKYSLQEINENIDVLTDKDIANKLSICIRDHILITR